MSDPKFKATLIAIVEEFFRQNNDVMLYVTETKDLKQASRNRLFVRWFNTYKHHELYVIKTADGGFRISPGLEESGTALQVRPKDHPAVFGLGITEHSALSTHWGFRWCQLAMCFLLLL